MKKKIMRWSRNIITALCILLVMVSTISIVYSRINPESTPSILGIRPMNILSGSMRPLLQPGDMVVAVERDPLGIKAGDVITFRDLDGVIVTHRVASVEFKDGSSVFTTRGDANNMDDLNQVSESQLLGVMLIKIPYGGYISNFIKSPPGIIMLAAVFIVLLIIGKIRNILSKASQDKNKEEASEGNVDIYNQP